MGMAFMRPLGGVGRGGSGFKLQDFLPFFKRGSVLTVDKVVGHDRADLVGFTPRNLLFLKKKKKKIALIKEGEREARGDGRIDKGPDEVHVPNCMGCTQPSNPSFPRRPSYNPPFFYPPPDNHAPSPSPGIRFHAFSRMKSWNDQGSFVSSSRYDTQIYVSHSTAGFSVSEGFSGRGSGVEGVRSGFSPPAELGTRYFGIS